MINLGGVGRAELARVPGVGGRVLANDEGGSERSAFPVDDEFLVTGEPGCRLSLGAGRNAPAAVLLEEAMLAVRIGGACTGLPGKAARAVGLTAGCGIIFARSSCCGVR